MSAPDSVFEALLDGWGDDALAPDVEVPACACGRPLAIGDFLFAVCEFCRARTRIPRTRGAERVGDRLRSGLGRGD